MRQLSYRLGASPCNLFYVFVRSFICTHPWSMLFLSIRMPIFGEISASIIWFNDRLYPVKHPHYIPCNLHFWSHLFFFALGLLFFTHPMIEKKNLWVKLFPSFSMHFPSFSMHFPSFSMHFPSFSIIFHHFPSFSIIFPPSLIGFDVWTSAHFGHGHKWSPGLVEAATSPGCRRIPTTSASTRNGILWSTNGWLMVELHYNKHL